MVPSTPSGRLALDIETISPGLSPDDDVDFEDPSQFEVSIIALAYDGPDAGGRLPRQRILFRQSPDPEAEFDLIREFTAILWAYNPEKIVTYAGDFFDLPVLKARPTLIANNPSGDGLHGDLSAALSNAESVDLGDYAAETYGYGTRLNGLIDHEGLDLRNTFFEDYDHGLDLSSVRPSDADTEYVDSGDVPKTLETLLYELSDTHESIGACNAKETKEMLIDYAVGDIEHLLTIEERI